MIDMLTDLTDLADADAVKARLASGETEAFPFDRAEQILDGAHPVRVFREYRGLSARELARVAGVAPFILSEIETARKPGSLDAMTRLAAALRVPLDLL
jgi:antitoxin component HigA of HigAB toxin-antitoxin module